MIKKRIYEITPNSMIISPIFVKLFSSADLCSLPQNDLFQFDDLDTTFLTFCTAALGLRSKTQSF